MNYDARRRVIDKALALIKDGSFVAVPAEDYFSGNTDDWCFGRHMQTSRDIPINEYAAAFNAISARPEVHSVWVSINEVPDDSDPMEQDEWPSSHQVFIITSSTST